MSPLFGINNFRPIKENTPLLLVVYHNDSNYCGKEELINIVNKDPAENLVEKFRNLTLYSNILYYMFPFFGDIKNI